MPKIISLDSECSGLDTYHGARPYYVNSCEVGVRGVKRWHWPVDPLTRRVAISQDDLDAIKALIDSADVIVGQNIKFDAQMLGACRDDFVDWPWHKTHDLMAISHLLGSNKKKDLTTLTRRYLRQDIAPLEDAAAKHTKAARSYCRRKLSRWATARKGRQDMPSATSSRKDDEGSLWKADMWLPGTLADHLYKEGNPSYAPVERVDKKGVRVNRFGLPAHPYRTVLEDYADADALVTAALFPRMMKEVRERDLEKIYEGQSRKLLPVIHSMEYRGVTYNADKAAKLLGKNGRESERLKDDCERLIRDLGGEEVTVGKGVSKTLHSFVFDTLKVPVLATSKKTGKPSLTSAALKGYADTLPDGPARDLMVCLGEKRARDTACNYVRGYERFSLPTGGRRSLCGVCKKGVYYRGKCGGCGRDDGWPWRKLNPLLNAFATNTLRCTGTRPNQQNTSSRKGFNLRYCFGPLPGREWWSLDYSNIELRIPAYWAGEQVLIDLFERSGEPPFYGSNHMLNFSIIYPEVWQAALVEAGLEGAAALCKDRYKDSYYKWCKGGWFAKQYGGQKRKVDSTFRREGAYDMLDERLSRIAALNRQTIDMARRLGYVETLPDRDVDPSRGYPILVDRDQGRVSPTEPFARRIQSTAMWCTRGAMPLCHDQLLVWERETGQDHYITLQVHDEIVFDLPRIGDTGQYGNIDKVRVLARLMTSMGDRIGVPLEVSASYIPEDWSKCLAVAL